jgi:hypothetical protein
MLVYLVTALEVLGTTPDQIKTKHYLKMTLTASLN